MHIGVDGNLLCGKKTGMGVVVCAILKRWKELHGNRVTVFLPEGLEPEIEKALLECKIEIKICGKSNYFKWEQIILPKMVKKEEIDILWCPYNTAPLRVSCPIVVTVHDMIYMSLSVKQVPSLYKKAGVLYRKIIVPYAVKNAAKIITISKFAKKEICTYFPTVKEKIEVVYNSTDINTVELNSEETEKFFTANNIRKPYILGFGSLEARKNSMGLIKAFCKLPKKIREQYQLVLFGFRGYRESQEFKYIQEKSIENVVILEYISDREKTTLYKNSKVFVFPSFSEGFGIPILEAYANKVPVITSNVTALPEIAGEAAILVNPSNEKEINEAILKVIEDDVLRDRMIQTGLRQLNLFDWQRTADKVWTLLCENI